MNILVLLGWFICGLIGAFIYFKKYRTESDISENYIGTEVLIFITIFYIWLLEKIMKNDG